MNAQKKSPARPTVARQVAVAVLLLVAVAAIAAFGALANSGNVDGWYASAGKAPWTPPNRVFAPAWTTLYLLIAIVGLLIWRAGYTGSGSPNGARKALGIYIAQLVLNAVWSPVFFAGYPLIGAAAWWLAMGVILALVLCVAWLIVEAAKWSRIAAWLLVPYAAWLLFASTLNAGIIALN